uniref:MMS22-like C-terminal domain-containing protein n=1 Tax=Timema bartmani TaxID=61472 RepID=A0A7R9FCK4_9NEOP|nr:unnamed protein product [Timema bartmani]
MIVLLFCLSMVSFCKQNLVFQAEKLQEYLGMLHLEKLSLARQNVVWKAHLALILLHISKGKDIKEVAQPLVSLVHCHTNDTALMKLFVKDLQHIFELNPTLELSRHVLFGLDKAEDPLYIFGRILTDIYDKLETDQEKISLREKCCFYFDQVIKIIDPLLKKPEVHGYEVLDRVYLRVLKIVQSVGPLLYLKGLRFLTVLTRECNDDEVVLQLVMELCLSHILKEAIREVTRVQQHLAFGLLNELLKSPLIDQNKQIRETFLNTLVGLYSHMAFSSQPLFQLLTKLARNYPKLIACTLPDLQREIKTVELSRGVAFDQSLRTAMSLIQAIVSQE